MHHARILVVANDPQTMSDMQDPRIASVHEIEIALTTDVAVTILDERKMDILVLDTVLTNGQGEDTIRSIKRSHPDLPIIAIGNRKAKTVVKKFKEAGADFYIVRPIESDVVTKAVEDALELVGALV